MSVCFHKPCCWFVTLIVFLMWFITFFLIEKQYSSTTKFFRTYNNICQHLAQLPPYLKNTNATEFLSFLPLRNEELRVKYPSVDNGEWLPKKSCHFTERLALIVPYRNRSVHLAKFLEFMHSFLQQQNVHYKIYIVEQTDNELFNRGSLINIGFKTALKEFGATCFIFHDIDLLPESHDIIYRCHEQPKLLAGNQDRWNYTMMYSGYFSGAIAVTTEQFLAVNGFSNLYFGWGGEDDDFSYRLSLAGIQTLKSDEHERYTSMNHIRDTGNESNNQRYAVLMQTNEVQKFDGLCSVQYNLIQQTNIGIATVLQVELIKKPGRYTFEHYLLWKAAAYVV